MSIRRTRPTAGSRPRSRVIWVMAIVIATVATSGPVGASPDGGGFEPNPRPHSVVVDWIETTLKAIERNPPSPTATTWRMWVVASSMYDAWSAYDTTAIATAAGPDLKSAARAHPPGSVETAISHAAHRALTTVFPAQRALFDGVLAENGLRDQVAFVARGLCR